MKANPTRILSQSSIDEQIPKGYGWRLRRRVYDTPTVSVGRQTIIKGTMKTNTILVSALAPVLALTTVRAADITPAETKAIAEEGFIYGLPIVMNYAVMYEYSVDKNSRQYKAPFNQINNEARVFTYKDTSVITPNSDTPYSILWTDLRAESVVISMSAVEKEA